MISSKWLSLSTFNLGFVFIWIISWATVGVAQTAPPQLYPSAICGRAGEVILVEGKNFTPNSLVDINWAGMTLGTDPSPVQVDATGKIVFQFIVPNDLDGPRPLRVSDGWVSAEILFQLGTECPAPATPTPIEPTSTPTMTSTPIPPTMSPEEPRLSCAPDGVAPDEILQVNGENFHPGVPFYQLRWDGVIIPWSPAGLTVGDNGKFTLSIVAPSDTYDMHTLVADDGRGGLAICYVNVVPRNPTPTSTATPTLVPTATPTWTPGPPPGITVTPTAIPDIGDYCAVIEAAFTRYPLVNSQIDAGITVRNINAPWPADQLQVRIWQYYNLFQWDTGVTQNLPAMAQGETMPMHLIFSSPQSGPTWFQVRLHEIATGRELMCPSAWYPLQIINAEPGPPAMLAPLDNVWLNTRQLNLDWLPAEVPDRAGPIEQYEVQLVDLGSGELAYQATRPDITHLSYPLSNDYGARQLAWRARVYNAAGWGLWSTALYFGVDTISPNVELSLTGEQGNNGWWRSPVTVRVGGSDSAPGSGLQATYLQLGETRWVQVIPGGSTSVEAEGSFDLHAYGRDGANNRSPVMAQPVKIDLQPPDRVEPIFSLEPTSGGWYTRPLTISLEAEDRVSGIATKTIRIDGGPWQSDKVAVTTTGQHTIEFMAVDRAGNATDIRSTTAKLDLTPPNGLMALNGSLCQNCDPARLSVAAGDADSGLAYWTLTLAMPRHTTSSLAAQGDTIIASGNTPNNDVSLDGGVLPAGPLMLTLAVQDVAGWTATEQLQVMNEPPVTGPTPTPWVMATATPWPNSTPSASPTPHSGGNVSNDQGNESSGDNGSGGSGSDDGGSGTGSSSSLTGASGYPVGGTVVPAILPVTGEGPSAVLSVLMMGSVVIILIGFAWFLSALGKEKREIS
jgi:hypothetical protein